MDGDLVTLGGGALLALILIAELFFHPDRARTRSEKLIGIMGKLCFVAGVIGAAMMWFTQGAIWSPEPRSCHLLASIKLKGQVYRTCSYLVRRYQIGEWLFFGSLVTLAISTTLDRLAKRRT
ncbi:MAG: hypothetical protein ACJ8FT_09355 [Sphingomonas sp.]